MKNYLINVLLAVVAATLLLISVNLYFRHQAAKNFAKTVIELIEERDTTHSLRNYEVLTDSLNNVCKEWLDDGKDK